MRVSGASGALPAWISTARGLAQAGLLSRGDRLPDELRFPVPEGMVRQTVEAGSGLPVADPEEERSILAPDPSHPPARRFAPVEPPRDLDWSEQAAWNQPQEPAIESVTPVVDQGEAVDGPPEGGSIWDAIE